MLRSRSTSRSLAAIVVAAVVFGCAPAGAHPFLLTTSPPRDQIVDRQPSEVRLVFNERVAGSFGAIRVYNDRGLRVDSGPSRVAGESVSVGLARALTPGTYVVHWRVVASDGHPAADSFVFHFRVATRAGVIKVSHDRSGAFRAGFRWAAFAALALLLGFAFFLGRGSGVRAVAGAALALLVGLLVADAVGLSGLSPVRAIEPSVMSQVVRTTTGTVRVVQIGLTALALAVPGVAVFAAAGALGAEAFAGHASTASTPAIAVAVQAVHVIAMGVWLGGLVAVIRRREILPRYRSWALAAVAALIATGTYNSFVEVGRAGRLVSTPYGRILLAKIALVVVVLVLAWFNRRRGPAAGRLWAEVGGIMVIVALAAALSGIAPARSGEGPVSKVFTLGPWRASFVVDPALTGANEVHLFLLSGPGELAVDVSSARVEVRLESGREGPFDVGMREEGKGHYVTESGALAFACRWLAQIDAIRQDGERFTRLVAFEISQ